MDPFWWVLMFLSFIAFLCVLAVIHASVVADREKYRRR